MSAAVQITVFRKKNGPLSKRIELIDDEIVSDGSACRMAEGTARRVKLTDMDALADLIGNMPSEEALALGRLHADLKGEVKVILARDLNDKPRPNVIVRTTEYLYFAAGEPAYLLLDHDRKGQPRAVSDKLKQLGGFWRAVVCAVAGLANAARVTRRSTSAGLYHRKTNQSLGGGAGRHVYIIIKDGADIERALKTLHERLWLAGLGYFVVGAAGQLLDRSIIDAAVYGPERLVFEGKPILAPPVAQDREERRPRVYGDDIIDTRVAIPPLSDEEQARLAQLKATERERLKPEAAKERRRWAKKFAARHGLSAEEAEKIAANATENHTLHQEFELVFDELGKCTVGDVLAAPADYVGQTLADPLEGVSYGRGKAKVFQQVDGRMLINSFAHGGIKYRLAGQGVGLDDFYSYMEKASAYFFTPNASIWPGSRVNARIPPVPLLDAQGRLLLDERGQQRLIPATAWLDQHQPVEQLTWAPGLPMLIENRLIAEGGWIERNGVRCFNQYRPPNLKLGVGGDVDLWLNHIETLYPDDAEHIIDWLAQRVQRPAEKINHALVLGGPQGIGKDTALEPVKAAIGKWNWIETSPTQVMGRFNGFLKSVILRISEARDLGEFNRYTFYDHLKAYTAAPPDVLRVDEKNLREHSILNCCGVIITTNHKTDGIYLPADDRRHYVAWSELTKNDFKPRYWTRLWDWYKRGGINNVAAYLAELDISQFNAKAPPPKTASFWTIVDAGGAPEDAEFADAIDALAKEKEGEPLGALTLDDIIGAAKSTDFKEWVADRKNRRQIPHRMEACGYVPVRNANIEDGRWRIAGKRVMIYALKTLSLREQQQAAHGRVKKGARYADDDDDGSLRLSKRCPGRYRYDGED